jgi:hypothetical protein
MSNETLQIILKKVDEHFAHKEHVASQVLKDLHDTMIRVEAKVEGHARRLDIANGRTAKNELAIQDLEKKHIEQITKLISEVGYLGCNASVFGNRIWEIVRYVIIAVISATLAVIFVQK